MIEDAEHRIEGADQAILRIVATLLAIEGLFLLASLLWP